LTLDDVKVEIKKQNDLLKTVQQ